MLEPDLLARFTTHLKEALQRGLAFALQQGRFLVEPGDLLTGLLQEKGSIGCEILTKAQVSLERVTEAFRGRAMPHRSGGVVAPDLAPMVKRILEKCVLTAHLYEHKYIGTEHLLFALLEMPLPDIHVFLESNGASLEGLKDQLVAVLKSTSKFPDIAAGLVSDMEEQNDEGPTPMVGASAEPRPRPSRGARPRALEVFARELTSPDVAMSLDPVIGREAETDRVIQILCRRMKNNPILLGDPGVGKTAIVEGLAQRLATGDVPDILQGKRVFSVDLALMVAGTMYRGEFEARLKQLVEEAKNDPHTILFIDEIHTMVGAGSTSGSLDAANILKPALARGEIRCIGATTWTEYKKHIEPDAALERRYQSVDVREPSADMTLRMLVGLKGRYEKHHSVTYAADTLEAAVRLAERYLTDRFFPDKAIDLLDEAAALLNAKRRSQESVERIRALDVAIAAAREIKDDAVGRASLAGAAHALDDEQRLTKERETLERGMTQSRAQQRLVVRPEHVAQVVARLAHVSLEAVLTKEHDQLSKLEDRLAQLVFGQPEAVSAVSELVRRARLGLAHPHRPKASFLFVGPSGVGKTELARALAKEIFGRDDALIKIDMSEFAEGHSVSKLLGSPAGYVGYRDSSKWMDMIRARPHAVLLFDEFEKAHVDVQHLLLQALEDGRLTDATGRVIPLRHAYLVLTSNVGSDAMHRARLGFDGVATNERAAYDTLAREQLAERFRPELLNRMDRVVVFRPLERQAIKHVLRRELDELFLRVKQVQRIAYTAGDDVLEWLLGRERGAEEGARAARRLVEQEIAALLGKALVAQPNKRKGTIRVMRDQSLKVA